MQHGRSSIGLSLSELFLAVLILVVLASLLVPALSESATQARQAVCLANVRTVAQAMRMYLTDNDYLGPPREYRPEVFAYFDTHPGGGGLDEWDGSREPHCHHADEANPYLRFPVILDTYVPNREVWRCPGARLESSATFINGGGPNWLEHLQAHEDVWGINTSPVICPGYCPSMLSWPSGWGGQVTDTLTQRRLAVPIGGKGRTASPGVFRQSIGTNEVNMMETTLIMVEDPHWWVVCGDAGAYPRKFNPGMLAYPDICYLECAGPGDWEADWENCPWSRECGARGEMKTDRALLAGRARHMGGTNIGFLDGTARWMSVTEILAESPSHGDRTRGRLRGIEIHGPTSDAPESDRSGGGVPPLF